VEFNVPIDDLSSLSLLTSTEELVFRRWRSRSDKTAANSTTLQRRIRVLYIYTQLDDEERKTANSFQR